MDWCDISSDTNAKLVCCGKEKAEYENEAVNLLIVVPTLTYGREKLRL